MTTKLPPLTDDELLQRYRDGATIAALINLAYRRNGIGRQRVREIVFGAQR
jgi:hypothetical protein